jgi:uncharacterized protein DUF1706
MGDAPGVIHRLFRPTVDGACVMGEWSVKDILAHVTTWEEEALSYVPLILSGGRPPRYTKYGGIDAFNAKMAEQNRAMELSDALRQLDETHHRLIDIPIAVQLLYRPSLCP